MKIDNARTAAFMGGGIATAGLLSVVRYGSSPGAIALGVATGAAAGAAQSAVESSTGSSELGWAASAATGTIGGALLLGSMGRQGLSPMQARGIGAALGLAAGVFGPVVGGMVLAQFDGE